MAEGNTEGILVNEPKPAVAGSDSNPPSTWWEKIKEYVHTGLDIAGAIPVIGAAFDGINGVIYSVEGDAVNAAVSFGSAALDFVPGAGTASKAAKFAYKGAQSALKLAEKTVVKQAEKTVVKQAEKSIVKQTEKNAVKQTEKNSAKQRAEDGIAVKDGKKKSANNKECPAVGHPVNPVLGIKFLAGETELDFTLPSYFSLTWQRRYFSDIAEDGWFGQGWTVPFSQHLAKRDDGLYFINEQGTSVKVPQLRPGQCKFDNYSQLYFSREANNRYRIAFTDGQADLIFSPLDISGHDPQGLSSSRFPLTGLEDKYGNHIRLIYSQAGLPSAIRTATGQWLTLTFITLTQPGGEMLQRLQCVSLRNDKKTISPLVTYCYSSEGDLCAVRDSSEKTQRQFEYKNHILIQQGVPGGVVSRYRYSEYSPSGKVLSYYTNLGQTWSFGYNAGNTVVTDPLNRKTCYQFNSDNELTAFTDAKNGTTHYVPDKNGLVTSVILPDKTETRCTYDLHGNMTSVTDPAGKKIYIHYDDKHNPVSVINETGKITRYTYDNHGGLKSITDALNQTTEYIRDKRGLITGIKDPCGNVYTFVYNPAGLLTETRDCSGAETRYIRNQTGNITEIMTPDGAVTRYSYAMNGMVSAVSHPDGTSDHYFYNSQRQLVGFRNTSGEQTVLQLAPDGLPLTKTDPAGGMLSCEYDPARRLTKLKNENGACYTFTYDDNDNLIHEQKFDGIVIRYQYNAANKLTKKYESGNDADQNTGILTVFRRDKNGKITEEIITTGDKESQIRNYYHYDDAGLLLCAGNNDSKNDYLYDAAGQCITEISEVLGQKRTLHYRYDNNGNCINMVLPDKTTLDYFYYGSGHLMQINSGSLVLCEIDRDIMHREISRTQGSLTSFFTYNKIGKVLSQKVMPASADNMTLSPLISRRYDYGEHGYLNRILELGRSKTDYRYDASGRMTAGGHERFNYDAAGNLVSPENLRGEASVRDNHLKMFGDNIYQYDMYGNLQKKSGKNTALTLHYSPEHRILRAEKISAGKRQDTEYGYDVFGRRIYKKSGGKTTIFLWDNNRLLEESNDECSTTYLYLPQEFIPVARREKKQNRKQGVFHYFHTDQIGTPREMTDAGGNCLWQGSFYAWGNTDKQSGELSQPLRFQGQYYDDETGLHYNRYRYYDPDIGRFITQDPIGLYGGNNAYLYAINPTGWVDPLGLMNNPGGSGLSSGNIGKASYDFDKVTKNMTIKTHGAPFTTQTDHRASGSSLAKQVQKAVDKEGGYVNRVTLQSCYSARGGQASQAQQLANRLNTPVTGYTGKFSEVERMGASRPLDGTGGIAKTFQPSTSAVGRAVSGAMNKAGNFTLNIGKRP
ncbi:RHS domain-containing protein [Morganella morganii]|nr:RHS domain-containing protein [Morganella morganii]